MGERRRIPGGSGVARDPKAIVGSPGNTPWAKNAKYEYGCYLSIILPSQNNRHNSKICSLIQTHISPLWGCLINLGTRVSRENGIWGGFGCYQKGNSTHICHFLSTGPRRGCQSGLRGGGSRAVEQKRGRRLSCVPVLGRYSFTAAEFTPPRRTASYTGRRRSRLGRAARRACPSRRCRRRGLPRSRRRCGSWTDGAR